MSAMIRILCLGLLVLPSFGCSTVSRAYLPSDRSGGDVFVTAGDIPEPYESLGVVQVSRASWILFGFWEPVRADLQAGFSELLVPAIREMGGDGAINVRFTTSRPSEAGRVFGALFFFFPLPSSVTVAGEVVRLRPWQGEGPGAGLTD
jgi:hypothetical protein